MKNERVLYGVIRWALLSDRGDRCLFILEFCRRLFFNFFPIPLCTNKLLGDWHVNRLDAQNNIVLLTYNPPILIAHWPLKPSCTINIIALNKKKNLRNIIENQRRTKFGLRRLFAQGISSLYLHLFSVISLSTIYIYILPTISVSTTISASLDISVSFALSIYLLSNPRPYFKKWKRTEQLFPPRILTPKSAINWALLNGHPLPRFETIIKHSPSSTVPFSRERAKKCNLRFSWHALKNMHYFVKYNLYEKKSCF
jgi:hypothetical protein